MVWENFSPALTSKTLRLCYTLRNHGSKPVQRYNAQEYKRFYGGHSKEDPPVPIPNTEVKLFSADGTARATVWESRSSPYFYTNPQSTEMLVGDFFCLFFGFAFHFPPTLSCPLLTFLFIFLCLDNVLIPN